MITKSLLALSLMFGGSAQVEAATPVLEKQEVVKFETQGSNQLSDLMKRIKIEQKKIDAERKQLLSEPHTLIEITLTEKYDNEAYFYDYNAEYEPRIYIDMKLMEHWGIDDMNVGDKITGIFDEEGWELNGFLKIKK